SQPAGRRRAVPPRVGAHRGRLPAARQLARDVWFPGRPGTGGRARRRDGTAQARSFRGCLAPSRGRDKPRGTAMVAVPRARRLRPGSWGRDRRAPRGRCAGGVVGVGVGVAVTLGSGLGSSSSSCFGWVTVIVITDPLGYFCPGATLWLVTVGMVPRGTSSPGCCWTSKPA